MRLLKEDELLAISGGSEADLKAATEIAKDACGEGNVESVTVERTENADGSTTVKYSYTCKDSNGDE